MHATVRFFEFCVYRHPAMICVSLNKQGQVKSIIEVDLFVVAARYKIQDIYLIFSLSLTCFILDLINSNLLILLNLFMSD